MVAVTEGALIGDVDGATAVLESLSALGVTIAIDGFGTATRRCRTSSCSPST